MGDREAVLEGQWGSREVRAWGDGSRSLNGFLDEEQQKLSPPGSFHQPPLTYARRGMF